MLFSVLSATVCFISCHGGPADHFATFAKNLSEDGNALEVYASGPALKKFQDRKIEVKVPFFIDLISSEEEDALAEQIAKDCSTASAVITDVGHPFDIKIQKALARCAPQVRRIAYYDNPESYVPGGYSTTAAQVMHTAQEIWFANANLCEEYSAIDFGSRKKIGVGYYPINQAEIIASRRETAQPSMRQMLFSKHDLVDTGQKILVYFGGNNEEYFSKAFPAFLLLLEEGMNRSDFTNLLIVLQQHPGAKNKNLDGNMVLAWKSKHHKALNAPTILLSDFNSDDAQAIADQAFYYQTSMGPQFVLAGIPTVQIGHETFPDILVRNQLVSSVTSVSQLISLLNDTDQREEISREVILQGLGIKENWLQILKAAIN